MKVSGPEGKVGTFLSMKNSGRSHANSCIQRTNMFYQQGTEVSKGNKNKRLLQIQIDDTRDL